LIICPKNVSMFVVILSAMEDILGQVVVVCDEVTGRSKLGQHLKVTLYGFFELLNL